MEFKIICRYHRPMHGNPQGTDFYRQQIAEQAGFGGRSEICLGSFFVPIFRKRFKHRTNIKHYPFSDSRTSDGQSEMMGKTGAHDDLTPHK
jgi:hypothetical protein